MVNGSGTTTVITHRPRGVVRCNVTLNSDGSGITSAIVTPAMFGRIVAIHTNGGAAGATNVFTLKDHKSGATIGVFTAAGAATAGLLRPTINENAATSTFGTPIVAATTATDVFKDTYAAGAIEVSQTAGGTSLTTILSIIVDEGGGASASQGARGSGRY